jgi:hypothetical protein
MHGRPNRAAACLTSLAAAYISEPAFAGPPFMTDDPKSTPLGNWEVYRVSAPTAARGDTGVTLIGTEVN